MLYDDLKLTVASCKLQLICANTYGVDFKSILRLNKKYLVEPSLNALSEFSTYELR